MHKKKYDLIIFDLDGTLYPKSEKITQAFLKGAAKVVSKEEDISIEEATEMIEQKREKLTQQTDGKVTYTLTLLTNWNVAISDYELEVSKSVDGINKIVDKDQYAINALEKVVAHYPIFLFTTNNQILAEKILKAAGLDIFFPKDRRFTVSSIKELGIEQSEITTYLKPETGGFEYIINKEKVNYEQVLMVGDSASSDIKPAEKLEMKGYHVTNRPDLYNLPAWLGLEG
mgnify:CR=1 FL=1